MGLNQNLWGPKGWFILHSLTLVYPLEPTEEDKKGQLEFLKSFSNVIPCEICSIHFQRNLVEYPPKLKSRECYFKWMVDVHNEVNGRTGKRAWTYQEALRYYQDKYQRKFKLKSDDEMEGTWWEEFSRDSYCFWIRYHTYIIIFVLLLVIAYLTLGGKERRILFLRRGK